MSNTDNNFKIPANIFKECQEIVDLLAELIDVPVGLIMRVTVYPETNRCPIYPRYLPGLHPATLPGSSHG